MTLALALTLHPHSHPHPHPHHSPSLSCSPLTLTSHPSPLTTHLSPLTTHPSLSSLTTHPHPHPHKDDNRSRSTTTTIPLTPTATPHLSPSPLTLALTPTLTHRSSSAPPQQKAPWLHSPWLHSQAVSGLRLRVWTMSGLHLWTVRDPSPLRPRRQSGRSRLWAPHRALHHSCTRVGTASSGCHISLTPPRQHCHAHPPLPAARVLCGIRCFNQI